MHAAGQVPVMIKNKQTNKQTNKDMHVAGLVCL
jgi:hypothetical protein